jgi:hypothetical protein
MAEKWTAEKSETSFAIHVSADRERWGFQFGEPVSAPAVTIWIVEETFLFGANVGPAFERVSWHHRASENGSHFHCVHSI